MEWPKVTIVTPTLNAEKVLPAYLEAIKSQDYPKDKLEHIIADGGSQDGTVELVKKYGALVYPNEKVTSESGKAVGVKKATGKYIALIDSDNILPTSDWLKRMVKPLEEQSEIILSEPWEFTYRKEDGFITRYCSLIGMNDPMVHFIGNYDRQNLLSGKWTEVSHEEKNFDDYIIATFQKGMLPTIGANGSVFRRDILEKYIVNGYIYDIDILPMYFEDSGFDKVNVIKVKNGVIHTYCESDINKFARKQRRRIQDFLFHNDELGDRKTTWMSPRGYIGVAKFILSCITIFPLMYQTIKGYLKKPDNAWFFHPLACEITLWEYSIGKIRSFFMKGEMSRENWRQ